LSAREANEGTCDTQPLRFHCELEKQKTQTTPPRKKRLKFLGLCLPLGRDALMHLARQVMQREVEELSSQTKKVRFEQESESSSRAFSFSCHATLSASCYYNIPTLKSSGVLC